ncbi:hypothetical protein AAFF_G00158330 [Aldrovandia affinis]|uniref:Uncharacterized protein n=1 Tax=Aldrovandia affinis TaxID=143900 RepID=A0AAD7RNQ0_9TELE|nr:hypothetical protein AAFF_G00158330 [Aldrovandia affinis]
MVLLYAWDLDPSSSSLGREVEPQTLGPAQEAVSVAAGHGHLDGRAVIHVGGFACLPRPFQERVRAAASFCSRRAVTEETTTSAESSTRVALKS